MTHAVKILPKYFDDCISGEKKFEIRKKDRPYCVGDFLALNEWDGAEYTGRCSLFVIDYILDDEEYCKKGCVTMSIVPCCLAPCDKPMVYEMEDAPC